MIEAELFTHLNTAIPALGGRIYPVLLPQNPTYPALTYQLIADPRSHSLDGPDGLVSARYQITPWAPKGQYADVKSTAEAVRLSLEGFSGAWGAYDVSAIDHQGGVDLYDPDVEVHYMPVDYVIRYAEV